MVIKNSHQIRFWLLNNYKIKIIIEVSDYLSEDNWYLTLATKILTTYILDSKLVMIIFTQSINQF